MSVPPFVEVRTTACQAGMDGECFASPDCPQLRDGEPLKTGRHCPLDAVPFCPWCVNWAEGQCDHFGGF